MKPFIYLDMDGVLANFEGWSKEVIGQDWKREIDSPLWGRYSEYPDLYLHLPIMPKAKELYELCCEIVGRNQVAILTALPNRARHLFPDAARHKTEWARDNIHNNIRVHFGPFAVDKQLHVRHEKDVLIDDMEININQWNSRGGIGILHSDAESSVEELNRRFYS